MAAAVASNEDQRGVVLRVKRKRTDDPVEALGKTLLLHPQMDNSGSQTRAWTSFICFSLKEACVQFDTSSFFCIFAVVSHVIPTKKAHLVGDNAEDTVKATEEDESVKGKLIFSNYFHFTIIKIFAYALPLSKFYCLPIYNPQNFLFSL